MVRLQNPQGKFTKTTKLAQDYYREKGEGRPTKKDRRAIDNLLNDFQEDNEL